MKARRKILPGSLPSARPRPDTARPARPRNLRRSRRRSASQEALDRSRGIAPRPASAVHNPAEAIDWEILPVSLVLDTDFDQDDEEITLGHARSMAMTLRDEEDWFPA